jgi:hypothetical protein
MSAADPRTAAANSAVTQQFAATQRGHLAAQKALWQIAQRQGGQELVDEARASLGADGTALAAFARSLLRGRQAP